VLPFSPGKSNRDRVIHSLQAGHSATADTAAHTADRLFGREEDDDERVRSFDLDGVNALLREHVHGKEKYGL